MNRLVSYSLGGGVVVCSLMAWIDREQFFRSYYYAFILWFCVSLGALCQLMTHHLSGGRWGFVVRRILEAALATIPALGVLFFIFFFGTEVLRSGKGYFLPGWVAFRSLVNFAIWIGLAFFLRRWSLRQDEEVEPQATRRLRLLSGPGLVLYFLTMSFAMTDWLMELEPGWRSTMFPGIIIATQTLLALSGATAVSAYLLPKDGPAASVATPRAWLDLGTLLFAFVIFWAYVAFSQLLIIWSGNLPAESAWYMRRGVGGWQWLAWGIGLVCCFAPAAVLLFQSIKRDRVLLARVAVAIWLSQAVFLFWVVVPAFFPAFHLSWMDGVATLVVGVLWGSLFWRAWVAAAPLPRNDPRMASLSIS